MGGGVIGRDSENFSGATLPRHGLCKLVKSPPARQMGMIRVVDTAGYP